MARALDREATERFGLPSLVLMEHASRGVAALAARLAHVSRAVLVLCGPGNNGGDGYGIARLLASWGLPVRVLRLAPCPPSGRTRPGRQGSRRPRSAVEDAWADPRPRPEALADATVVVDALFGVGLARDLEEPYTAWIGP